TWIVKSKLAVWPCAISRITSSVVRMLPISTTNMTGFFATCRGSSFMNASLTARLTIDGSNSCLFCALSVISLQFCLCELCGLLRLCVEYFSSPQRIRNAKTLRTAKSARKKSEHCSCPHQVMLNYRPQRQHWEKGQRADNRDYADEQNYKKRRVNRERSRRGRHDLLHRQIPRDRHHRNDHQKPPDQHRDPQRRVVPIVVDRDAVKRRAVVARGRHVGVDDLGQTMRPAVVDLRCAIRSNARPG